MAKSVLRRALKSISLTVTISLVVLFLICSLSPYINPANWWFFGFTGLIVPYLILLLFFSFIFWLIVKPILAWIPLLSLCLGWQQIDVAFAWHAGAGFSKKSNQKCAHHRLERAKL